MEKDEFAEYFRNRTKKLALEIIKLYKSLPKTDENVIIGKQLLRCSTSVAANYRAACRARSKAEFFSKISIVVEEADETLFWLELLFETVEKVKQQAEILHQEALEILKIVAKARKNIY